MKKIIIIFLVVFLLNIWNIFNVFWAENTKIYELNMKLAKEKILKKENWGFYIKSIDERLEKFSKEELENILQKIPLYLEKNREKNRDFVIYIKNKSVILLKTWKNISENSEKNISKKEWKILKNTVIWYEFDLWDFEVEEFKNENFTLKLKNDEEIKVKIDFDLRTKEDFEKEWVKNFEEFKEKFSSMVQDGMEIKSKNFWKINWLLIKDKEKWLMLLAYNEKKWVSLNMLFEWKNYQKYEKDFENLVLSFEFDNQEVKIKKGQDFKKWDWNIFISWVKIFLEKTELEKIKSLNSFWFNTENWRFKIWIISWKIEEKSKEYKDLIPENFEINWKKYKKYNLWKDSSYILENWDFSWFVVFDSNSKEKFPKELEQALKTFEFTTFIKK